MAAKAKANEIPPEEAGDDNGQDEKPKKRKPLSRLKRKPTDVVKVQCEMPLHTVALVDYKARLDGTTRSGLLTQWAMEKTKHLAKGMVATPEGEEEAAA